MTNNGEISIKANKLIALILAVAPILNPYILIELGNNSLMVMDLILIFFIMYTLLFKKNKDLPNMELFILIIVFFTLTLISFLYPIQGRSISLALRVLIVWSFYTFCVGYMWKIFDYDLFIKYSTKIAIVSTVLLIIQFLAVSRGYFDFYDGKLPLLNIGRDWAGLVDVNTGDIRVSSFFQEPSYYGIYCLPVLAQALKKQKFKLTVFLFIGLILTSSLVAIFGGCIILIYISIIEKKMTKKVNLVYWKRIIGVMVVGAILFIITYNLNENVQNVVNYSIRRASMITNELQGERMGSTKIRLIGYGQYFQYYPMPLKIFGVGANQYALYLSNYNVLDYSSTLVTTLLNYGIIGLVIFIGWLLKVYFKTPFKLKCFALIFIIICLVDRFWFNWYFFYILTWFLPFMNRKKLKKENAYE